MPPFQLPDLLSATLVLVRHGESIWVAEGRFQGRADPPLSGLGEEQARLVAERLAAPAGLPIPAGRPAAIWHSPLRRVADTAQLIAERQPPEVERRRSDDLTELGQGDWEGLLHAEVSARWPNELARWRTDPSSSQAPGGESLGAAATRVRRSLAAITDHLADEDGSAWAIVVAHDGVLRLALMTLLGIEHARFWSFPFDLCAISIIALDAGRACLTAHNLADHLAPLAATGHLGAAVPTDRGGAL